MDIAAQLQVARVDAGLSASALGRIAGVPASTVIRIENGASASVATLNKVLDAVGMRIDLAASSRPSAIASARWVLGDQIETPADLEYWLSRWERAGWLDAEDRKVSQCNALVADAGKMAPYASVLGR